MVILAQAVRAKEVITTIDASMAIDETGFSVTRTKVGDTHVSEELRKRGDFGGEPSGSWIFPSISLCPDGISERTESRFFVVKSASRMAGCLLDLQVPSLR